MSRIGKKPIPITSGVTVNISGQQVSVKGPKGQLERVIPTPISVAVAGDEVNVTRPDDSKTSRSLHGLSRTLVSNMVTGVVKGFEKKLEIVGVGYKAALKGKVLVLNLGYSHTIDYSVPDGVDLKVEKGNAILVSGISKEKVGQVAAEIRKFRKPSVYSGKGIKYADEYVRRKVGKAAAS